MTREEIEARIENLKLKREALIDQLADVDTSSASISAGGGAKSYTNRSVSELKAKIKFIDREINRLEASIGRAINQSKIVSVYPRYRV